MNASYCILICLLSLSHTHRHNVKERKRKLILVHLFNMHFYLVMKFSFTTTNFIPTTHCNVQHLICYFYCIKIKWRTNRDLRFSLLLLLRKSKYHILFLSFRRDLNNVFNCGHCQICQDQSL